MTLKTNGKMYVQSFECSKCKKWGMTTLTALPIIHDMIIYAECGECKTSTPFNTNTSDNWGRVVGFRGEIDSSLIHTLVNAAEYDERLKKYL